MAQNPAMASPEQDARLDARGLRCPLPVIRMEAMLRRMAPGACLLVIADDPIAAVDIPHFSREGGHSCTQLAPEAAGLIAGAAATAAGVCVFLVTRGEKE
ncbi:MAG: sulfurtransferase TusA family protein [Parvularculaceae bacterium]|nr:sulfurtransferase TusA family protein [Parvularculaceae bacterium]